MALENENAIKNIICKLSKILDTTYVSFFTGNQYKYATEMIDGYALKNLVQGNLSEEELATFVAALVQDEVEVNKLVQESVSFVKLFNKIKECNAKHFAKSILETFTEINAGKKEREELAKKQKENRELYRAARLSARQKQVLTSLGLTLSAYEKAT